MYTVKFHNQGLFGGNLAGQGLALGTISAQLPQEQSLRLPYPKIDGWSGSYQESSFERALHQELNRIKIRENLLKRKIAAAHSASPQQQQNLKDQYMALERTKKVVALWVDNMQKSLQAIAANFR
jgi:hypothetical protein